MTERTATLDEAIVLSKKLFPSDRLRLVGVRSEQLRNELQQGFGTQYTVMSTHKVSLSWP